MALTQVIPAGNGNNLSTTGATEYNVLNCGHVWNATINHAAALWPAAGNLTKLTVTITAAPGGTATRVFTVQKSASGAFSFSDTSATVSFGAADTTQTWTGSVAVSAGDLLILKSTDTNTPAAADAIWGVSFQPTTADQSILAAGTSDDLHTSATEYNCLMPASNEATANVDWTATENDVKLVMPAPGTMRDLYVELQNAPGAAASGDKFNFTARKNGAASALTVELLETATTNSDTANDVTVAAGDTFGIQSVPTSGPTVGDCWYGLVFDPDTVDEHVLVGASPDLPSGTEYCGINGLDIAWGGNVVPNNRLITEDKKIKNLYIDMDTAPGAGNSRTLTLMVNGVASLLTHTISDTATTGSDTANIITVSAGDTLAIRHTESGTPSDPGNIRWGVVVAPTSVAGGRIMGPIAGPGGLAGEGGIAGQHGGIAG